MPFRPAWTTCRSSGWRAASISWRVQATAALDPLGMGSLQRSGIGREMLMHTIKHPPALDLLARTPTTTCSDGEVGSTALKAKCCHGTVYCRNDLGTCSVTRLPMEKAERRRIDADQDVVFVPVLNHAPTEQKGPGATGTSSPPRAASCGAVPAEGMLLPVSGLALPDLAVVPRRVSTGCVSSGCRTESTPRRATT